MIDKYYVKDIFSSLVWFFSPDNWLRVAANFGESIANFPLLVLVGLGIVVLHWRFRLNLKRRLTHLLDKNPLGHSFGEILSGMGYLMLLSLYGALLMAWIGGVLLLNARADFLAMLSPRVWSRRPCRCSSCSFSFVCSNPTALPKPCSIGRSMSPTCCTAK
ncbi:hypothetical protein [Methylomonas koyamae]|uniref:hypothetical protein n=1 Tax=Methylomonas koyamae TaxID=702114 RepID=UPI0006D0F7E9|nr:hypothetical protein [Methylomonas koyamae]